MNLKEKICCRIKMFFSRSPLSFTDTKIRRAFCAFTLGKKIWSKPFPTQLTRPISALSALCPVIFRQCIFASAGFYECQIKFGSWCQRLEWQVFEWFLIMFIFILPSFVFTARLYNQSAEQLLLSKNVFIIFLGLSEVRMLEDDVLDFWITRLSPL